MKNGVRKIYLTQFSVPFYINNALYTLRNIKAINVMIVIYRLPGRSKFELSSAVNSPCRTRQNNRMDDSV